MVKLFQFLRRRGIGDGVPHVLSVIPHHFQQFDLFSDGEIEINATEEDSKAIFAPGTGEIPEEQELVAGVIGDRMARHGNESITLKCSSIY